MYELAWWLPRKVGRFVCRIVIIIGRLRLSEYIYIFLTHPLGRPSIAPAAHQIDLIDKKRPGRAGTPGLVKLIRKRSL